MELCRLRWLVEASDRLIQVSDDLFHPSITNAALRMSFFGHFCGGESVGDVRKTMESLDRQGLNVMLDYAIEADASGDEPKPMAVIDAECDANAACTMESLTVAAETSGDASVKLTSMTDPDVLLRVSSLLKSTPIDVDSCGESLLDSLPDGVTASDKAAFAKLLQRTLDIGSHAADLGSTLFIDAEQTYLQPAIDLAALHAQRTLNTDRAVVYNTYQSYLKDCRGRLLADIDRARREEWVFGAKVVRGAYMVQERALAAEDGYDSPIYDTKQHTHDAYNANIETLLENLDCCEVLVATHNTESVERAMAKVASLGVEPSDPRVSFGQLLGMCDFISVPVAAKGFRVLKCTPYGPIRKVVPYLQRRAIENSDVLGGAGLERELLLDALKARIGLQR